MSISKSPERHSFQAQSSIKKLAEDPNNLAALDTLGWYNEAKISALERENDETWQHDNMEYDLRTTDWILEKVRSDDIYAQHLYAAMCNREFTKNAVWPLLQNKKWSCSWRHAGGIVADMRQEGDYIDWYCSGIVDKDIPDEEFQQLTHASKERYLKTRAYVHESIVTGEIRADLLKAGWIVVDE